MSGYGHIGAATKITEGGSSLVVKRQWAIDFDVFSGTSMSYRAEAWGNADTSGADTVAWALKYGGTSLTNDGSQIASDSGLGVPPDDETVTGYFARPSGPQIVKLLMRTVTGKPAGTAGEMDAWSFIFGNQHTRQLKMFDGGMTGNLSCTDTLIRQFTVRQESLPSGLLELVPCIYHAGDSDARMVVRQGGSRGSVDGDIVGALSLSASAGAESVVLPYDNPGESVALKVCLEDSAGVNVCGMSLAVRARTA